MDLKVYYQKIREIEASIAEPFVVVVSRATEDGGKAGVRSEVARRLAAKLIAEETARLASEEEAAQFRAEVERQWRAAAEEEEIPEAPAKKRR
ncbi:MAG TPA: hypothetical protein VKV74_00235 [Bryobacteraceae bacterium]|nr:hypothetical protein [Bryobacteraceae bacterium]